MKDQLIKIVEYLLGLIPLPLLKFIIKRPLTAIFYHAVSEQPMPHVDSIYPSISASQFEKEMEYLQSKYRFVSYQQVGEYLLLGKQIPKNAIHLSFDDGFAECYSVVLPILEKLNIPCTFFITTAWLDNKKMFFRNKVALLWNLVQQVDDAELIRLLKKIEGVFSTAIASRPEFRRWIFSLKEDQLAEIDKLSKILQFDEKYYLSSTPLYLSTDEVKDMVARGFTIGAHTISHPKLENVDFARMDYEISESCKQIQEITGEISVPFAFPNSATNIDRTQLREIYNKHSHVGVLFNTKGVNSDEEFIINRVWAEKKLPDVPAERRILTLFKRAYQEAVLEQIRLWFR